MAESVQFPIVVRDRGALPFRIIRAADLPAGFLAVVAGGTRVGQINAIGGREDLIKRAETVVRDAVDMELSERQTKQEMKAVGW